MVIIYLFCGFNTVDKLQFLIFNILNIYFICPYPSFRTVGTICVRLAYISGFFSVYATF